MLRWMLLLTAAGTGVAVGVLAAHWKRRNGALWMIYGMVTFGAAGLVLAGLPRLERRRLPGVRDGGANWHG